MSMMTSEMFKFVNSSKTPKIYNCLENETFFVQMNVRTVLKSDKSVLFDFSPSF